MIIAKSFCINLTEKWPPRHTTFVLHFEVFSSAESEFSNQIVSRDLLLDTSKQKV